MQGFRLIADPAVRPYVVVPLLINVTIFMLGYVAIFQQVDSLMAQMVGAIPTWLAWITWLIWPLVVLVVVFVSAYLFTTIANLIAAPFNGFLSEKIEQILSGQVSDNSGSWWAVLAEIIPSIINEFRKMGYFLLFAVPMIALLFVPLVNVFIAPLWFLFGCWMQALQYRDVPMANRGLMFKDVKAECERQRFVSLGFGASVLVAASIPLLNLFVVPAAVAGATAMDVAQKDVVDTGESN